MRSARLAGIALLVVARTARAQVPVPDEPSVELGPPPPPPPGAARTLEPDTPLPEAREPLEPDAPLRAERSNRPDEPPPFVVETPSEPDSVPSDQPTTYPDASAVPGWYGWQILIGDAGAAAWALLPGTTGLVLGGGVYLLTGPAIHLGHKQGIKALGSFALRLGVPLATSMILDEKICSEPCVTPGIFVSAVVVSLVDAAWLAREEVPPREKTLTIAPSVAAGRKRVAFSLRGSF